MLALPCLVLASACTKQVQLVRAPGVPKLPALAPTENVRLVLPQDEFVPVPASQIAYYHRGVTPGGPCTYKEVLDDAVLMARNLGAHTARVVSLQAPDSYSSCYRVDVVFYR